jgi:hypothetical protein
MATLAAQTARMLGANIRTSFHCTWYNPWINYPFLTVDHIRSLAQDWHRNGLRAKLYYTVRELSNHAFELWALRSLDEVIKAGKGAGGPWLQEHLLSNYTPGWYCTPEGIQGAPDASIHLTGMSRWLNYYVESPGWLAREAKIDGIYFDGTYMSRKVFQRVRRILDLHRPGCLLDLHAGNNITRKSNTYNDFMEHLPYLDSTWIGEGFDYAGAPDFWMVERSGIPFGVPNDMLHFRGNPWSGMLYGLEARFIENQGASPTTLWSFWDEFGIQEARMIGYWDDHCPMRTSHPQVLATVYRKRDQTLVVIASWAPAEVAVRLTIDWQALGLEQTKARIFAPPIPGYRRAAEFRAWSPIPVSPRRGWLLVIDNRRGQPRPRAIQPSCDRLLIEDGFAGSQLGREWRVRATSPATATVKVVDNRLVVAAPAGGAAFVERPLPAGAEAVECSLYFPIEGRRSEHHRWVGEWSPGLAVVSPRGCLRLSVGSKGWFVIDDGTFYEMCGDVPSLAGQEEAAWSHLRIWWDQRYVHAEASAEGKAWETLRALPRAQFLGDPVAIRMGKMSRFADTRGTTTGAVQERMFGAFHVYACG